MKAAILISLVILASAGPQVAKDDNAEVVPQSVVDYINSVQDSWVASKEWVGSMTLGEAKTIVNTEINKPSFPEYNWGSLLDYFAAPTSFDARTQWPNCIHPILDQGKLRSSWAFGATGALSDRFCIASKGAVNVVLSPKYIVDCYFNNLAGYEESSFRAWDFMKTYGVPTDSCVSNSWFPDCSSYCSNWSSIKLYKATRILTYSTPASIQAAIISEGPIEATFTVYHDFFSYSSGVYIHTYGDPVGDSSVKIIGWGVSGTRNYWICASSFGKNWGMEGYIWIGFGQCGIDKSGIAGLPVF